MWNFQQGFSSANEGNLRNHPIFIPLLRNYCRVITMRSIIWYSCGFLLRAIYSEYIHCVILNNLTVFSFSWCIIIGDIIHLFKAPPWFFYVCLLNALFFLCGINMFPKKESGNGPMTGNKQISQTYFFRNFIKPLICECGLGWQCMYNFRFIPLSNR